MSGVNGIGGAGSGGSVAQIIALRQQIIDRTSLLKELHEAKQTEATHATSEPAGGGLLKIDDLVGRE